METMNLEDGATVLDVGGTVDNWKYIDKRLQITLLNLSVPSDAASYPSQFTCVQGNGTNLEYPDNSFDVVFSNSVIEHVFPSIDQHKFAAEALRVGKRLFLQTPSKYFFIEPHFIAFFIHYLPKNIQKLLFRYFSLRGVLNRFSATEINTMVDSISLLSFDELEKLFHGCTIYTERFLFFPKHYIVIS